MITIFIFPILTDPGLISVLINDGYVSCGQIAGNISPIVNINRKGQTAFYHSVNIKMELLTVNSKGQVLHLQLIKSDHGLCIGIMMKCIGVGIPALQCVTIKQ